MEILTIGGLAISGGERAIWWGKFQAQPLEKDNELETILNENLMSLQLPKH